MNISHQTQCDICASRGPCHHCGRSGNYKTRSEFGVYLRQRDAEFYRLEKVGSDIVCERLLLTIDYLGTFANMISLGFAKNEPPLFGWPTFEEIFKDKKISSVCTSLTNFKDGRFFLFCALR